VQSKFSTEQKHIKIPVYCIIIGGLPERWFQILQDIIKMSLKQA